MDAMDHRDLHRRRRPSPSAPPSHPTSLISLAQLVFVTIFLPETYPGAILTTKAQRLRRATGNWALHSELEAKDLSLRGFLEKNLTRPLTMLVKEPMMLSVCVYNAFVCVHFALRYSRSVRMTCSSGRSYGILCPSLDLASPPRLPH